MSTPATPKLEVLPTPADVAAAAAERIVDACARALDHKETFTLCLAGGSTPKAAYELLATPQWVKQINWVRTEIFFGDERTVPPDHPDSNFAMAKAALLDHVPIPGDNIYRMKGESDPEAAAKAYGEMLKDKFSDSTAAGLDLLLLGMGDDGHTLSLFPHTAALDEGTHRCVANFIPRLNTWRITLTAGFANRSAEVLALITGQNKAPALIQVLEGNSDPKEFPIKLISPEFGRLTYLLDASAAEMEAE